MIPVNILCLSAALFLSACAAAPRMPEQYLGWWEPINPKAGDIGINIRPDGIIEDRSHDLSGKILGESRYRVIKIEDDKLHMLVNTPAEGDTPPYRKYARLTLEAPARIAEDLYADTDMLWYEYNYCGPDQDEYETLSAQDLWNIVEKRNCRAGFDLFTYSRPHG